MQEVLLLKMGEVVLKGLNRRRLEDLLYKNLRQALYRYEGAVVSGSQSTAYVNFETEDPDVDGAFEAAKRVFGFVRVTRALKTSTDWETLKAEGIDYLAPVLCRAKTFKVESRRSDKSYPKNSMQISCDFGGDLLEAFPNLTVDVHHPQVTVYVEIREGYAYVHTDPDAGAGGMPVGSAGKGMLMLSGGIDSPVAGYKMARRGMPLCCVYFESPPYTSPQAREKVLKLAKQLSLYAGPLEVYVVSFTQLQETLRDCCQEDFFTVLLRRAMLKIACRLADEHDCKCLITGESLGQVASQTLGALVCTDRVSDRPVFRPLIGDDKQEIVDIAQKIGTFETSILPYEDCCTVFTPKHPKTNPKPEELEKEEAKYNFDEATAQMEIHRYALAPWKEIDLGLV